MTTLVTQYLTRVSTFHFNSCGCQPTSPSWNSHSNRDDTLNTNIGHIIKAYVSSGSARARCSLWGTVSLL